jgi:hypothetical protein
MSGPVKVGRPLLFLMLMGFLAGCASINDLSRETFRRGTLVDHPLAREGVAVLPMWSRGEVRDYLPSAQEIFLAAFAQMRPNLRIIAPKETRRLLEEVDSAYRSAEEAFTARRVSREEDLRQIGRTLNARFVLESVLDRAEIAEGATQVMIRAQLWDVEMGDVVWEGIGESRGYLFLIFPRAPASLEKALEVASRGLIKQLP